VSVYSHRTQGVEYIVRRAQRQNYLPHPQIRVTTVGKLRAAGYEVVLRGKYGHALILLDDSPSDDDWPKLASLFDPARPNPGYEEGR
jgi:hypothetical protein